MKLPKRLRRYLIGVAAAQAAMKLVFFSLVPALLVAAAQAAMKRMTDKVNSNHLRRTQ
jgi:hypothetical protein